MKEALLYEKLLNKKVRCNLCAHNCIIAHEKRGTCQVRENREGTLNTLVYGQVISQHVDPIEKKPLFHFYPGTTAFSIGTPGCNFHCQWCQNWEISQMPPEKFFAFSDKASPEQIVLEAKKSGCRSIAYTYTEPTIFFEYAYDTAKLAHKSGLENIIITNGYMTEEMTETFHPFLDAVNVDLKSFRDFTYKKFVGARLQPVLDSLKKIKQLGIWLEVTTLVIPGINDEPSEIRDIVDFIVQELGEETPWHISRFFPSYKMTKVPSTPLSTIRRTREIGLEEGLHYVYQGNIQGEANTYCHACGYLLIHRYGYTIQENHVGKYGCCPNCSTKVAGKGMHQEFPE